MIKVDVRAPDIMFEVKVTLQKILSIKVDEELEILVASNMTLLSSNITLYSDYCTWFIALLASPYILFSTWRCLFLAEFESSVYISIQFELHGPVQSMHYGQ